MQNDLVALGAVAAVFCMLVATQAFGHIELKMLISRIKWLLLAVVQCKGDQEVSFQIQGTRQWDILWQSLVEYGEKMDLVDIRLDINLAAAQEAYHASWRRPASCERRERWRAEVPFFSGEHTIGRLSVTGGRRPGVSSCEAIDQLMELLEPLEAEIVALSTEKEPTEPKSVQASTVVSSPTLAP